MLERIDQNVNYFQENIYYIIKKIKEIKNH